MRALLPLSCLLLFSGVALADPDPSALRDEALGSHDLAARLADAQLDVEGALEALRAPGSGGATGSQRVTLEDSAGRQSSLEVRVPAEAPPARGYPCVVVLHGLRGNAKQLLPLAEKLAPPNSILLAPSAEYLAPEQENEDMWEVGGGEAVDPGDDPAAKRREALRRLLRQGRDQLFPHWWNYKPDNFALQALAWAHARYPIDPDRVVLLGYSMGGYGAWNVGLRYPDRFAAIVPISGGISRKENMVGRDEISRALLRNGREVPSFFLHGNRDTVVPFRFSSTIASELEQLGAEHVFVEVPGGGHILRSFLDGDDSTVQLKGWIASHQRDGHPRVVDHTVVGAYHGASWWVRVDALDAPTANVRAEVLDGGLVRVTTEGVTRLTLFVDPTLLDPAKVRVELNGTLVHDGPVAASLEAVAESWAGRHDPSLVYGHMLQLEVGTAEPATAPPAESRRF